MNSFFFCQRKFFAKLFWVLHQKRICFHNLSHCECLACVDLCILEAVLHGEEAAISCHLVHVLASWQRERSEHFSATWGIMDYSGVSLQFWGLTLPFTVHEFVSCLTIGRQNGNGIDPNVTLAHICSRNHWQRGNIVTARLGLRPNLIRAPEQRRNKRLCLYPKKLPFIWSKRSQDVSKLHCVRLTKLQDVFWPSLLCLELTNSKLRRKILAFLSSTC